MSAEATAAWEQHIKDCFDFKCICDMEPDVVAPNTGYAGLTLQTLFEKGYDAGAAAPKATTTISCECKFLEGWVAGRAGLRADIREVLDK